MSSVTYKGAVYPWQCDHIGHMNVMWYVGKFDEANWNFLAALGLTPTYFAEQHRGMAAVQQNIAYKHELLAGNIVEVRSRALEIGDKSLRLLHEMRNAETQELSASCELTIVHIDLNGVALDERGAVIFVHGYNVSFEQAALRAAQIGFDLSIKGAMAFFSWPSQGALGGYLADAAAIEASEDAIADYMTDFALNSGAAAVHVIAHSMGNRGVLRAVNNIIKEAETRTKVRFGQIILAAADVDADVFRRLSAAYSQVASRTTLYVSKRDLAVEAARWLHNYPRAGLLPPVLVCDHIDTINVTNADLTTLGHGYVADARDVLQDMHDLLVHNASPEKRFGLREMRNEEGKPFWLIGA